MRFDVDDEALDEPLLDLAANSTIHGCSDGCSSRQADGDNSLKEDKISASGGI